MIFSLPIRFKSSVALQVPIMFTNTSSIKKATIYFDGGSNPNPGPSACGYVIEQKDIDSRDSNKDRKVGYGFFLGYGTNNKAEYKGLTNALKWCVNNNINDCEIYGDSKLVIEQINGRWKVKEPTLQPYYKEAKEYLEQLKLKGTVKCTWVPRDKNKDADEMCNIALDSQTECFKVF
jgi:ribonuclease HI